MLPVSAGLFPEYPPLQRLAHGARAGVSARAVPLRPGYSDIRTVFTIHNLKFQGQYSPHVLNDILGLDGVAAARNQLLRDDGKCVNYLAGAVSYSDRVTTVSPTYARRSARRISARDCRISFCGGTTFSPAS